MSKPKLELTWIGKGQRPRLKPHILREDPARSCYAEQQRSAHDRFDKRMIVSDNPVVLIASAWGIV
ncbi:MAG: hypothetical protein ACYDDD_02075 [Acidithiobacillus ferrivorans]